MPEKSALLTGLGIGMTFIIGLVFVSIIPSFNENWSQNTARDAGPLPRHLHDVRTGGGGARRPHATASSPATSARRATRSWPATRPSRSAGGASTSAKAVCTATRSRSGPLTNEIKRYSIGTSVAPIADEREYIWDQPHFLGTRRIGPDLSREGGKYSDDWHYSHFYYPRQMVPGSIMPAFTWLFDDTDKINPVPNQDARDLVAYVQTLGFGRKVPDGHGGWRPWLKPEDQQYTQARGPGPGQPRRRRRCTAAIAFPRPIAASRSNPAFPDKPIRSCGNPLAGYSGIIEEGGRSRARPLFALLETMIDLTDRIIQTDRRLTRAANGSVKWHAPRRLLQCCAARCSSPCR